MKLLLEKWLEESGINLNEGKVEKLSHYVEDLYTLGKRLGLISKKLSKKEIFFLHILDSLMVTKFLFPSPKSVIVDVGSRSGLPGIPVSLFWSENKVVLIDSKQKPTSFLLREKEVLELNNVEILRGFVSERFNLYPYDIVLVRAFLPPSRCIEELLPLLKKGALLVFYLSLKGWEREKSQIELENMEVETFFYQIPYFYRRRAIVILKKF